MNDALSQAIRTAHIHLDSATLRVHVDNIDNYDLDRMEAFKPDCVMGVSRSNDPSQNKQSFLVCVCGEYDLEEIADMVECGRK